MQDMDTVWSRYQENKEELKSLRKQMNDVYMGTSEYAELYEQRKEISAKMRRAKMTLNEGYESVITRMDDLKIDIDSDKQMLSDMILTKISKQEPFELVDKYDQPQLPLFSIKFVKVENPGGE